MGVCTELVALENLLPWYTVVTMLIGIVIGVFFASSIRNRGNKAAAKPSVEDGHDVSNG